MKRGRESGKAVCGRKRQGIWENRAKPNSQKKTSQSLTDDKHSLCLSGCFNGRSAVTE